jgi:hypothetical protein
VRQRAGRAGPTRPVNAALLQDRGETGCAAAIAGVTAQTPAVTHTHAPVTSLRRSCPGMARGSNIGEMSIYLNIDRSPPGISSSAASG